MTLILSIIPLLGSHWPVCFVMLKLQQGQVWKAGDEYLRIVDLQRLEVKYKSMKDLEAREGTHHHVSKKEFCRLIKNATLLSSEAPEV
jgi:hypothetical protein